MTVMFDANDLRLESRNKPAKDIHLNDIYKKRLVGVMYANVVMIQDSYGQIKILKNRYGNSNVVLKSGDLFPKM